MWNDNYNCKRPKKTETVQKELSLGLELGIEVREGRFLFFILHPFIWFKCFKTILKIPQILSFPLKIFFKVQSSLHLHGSCMLDNLYLVQIFCFYM